MMKREQATAVLFQGFTGTDWRKVSVSTWSHQLRWKPFLSECESAALTTACICVVRGTEGNVAVHEFHSEFGKLAVPNPLATNS